MKVLLDTNIIIHREASRVINEEIGQLFNWLDKLKYEKCVHPLTASELSKHKDKKVVDSMNIKLSSYNILKTTAPIHDLVRDIIDSQDKNENDVIDSKLLNELLNARVDLLITEDKNIHKKSQLLSLDDKVFKIDEFLELVLNENPDLVDYKVLAVRKEYFGNIDVNDDFFDSFREDYKGFDKWFNKKSDQVAYICKYEGAICAFLYIKLEDKDEHYKDLNPIFRPAKRLKIGTLKVTLNGLKLGERFLKIIFDNAIVQNVDEIYVTIFNKRPGQALLIGLLETYGFYQYGIKRTGTGEELVYVKEFRRGALLAGDPKTDFPFISRNRNVYFVSIYPPYHTELFPDSILNTESPDKFIENEPHRNAIRKVYVSHAIERPIRTGDALLFYRTGGLHKGVVTTVAAVDSVIDGIRSEAELKEVCRKRTALTDSEIKEFWNRYDDLKPFVVNLLYTYSLPSRINLKRLIDLGVIKSANQMPRGFGRITWDQLTTIINESRK